MLTYLQTTYRSIPPILKKAASCKVLLTCKILGIGLIKPEKNILLGSFTITWGRPTPAKQDML